MGESDTIMTMVITKREAEIIPNLSPLAIKIFFFAAWNDEIDIDIPGLVERFFSNQYTIQDALIEIDETLVNCIFDDGILIRIKRIQEPSQTMPIKHIPINLNGDQKTDLISKIIRRFDSKISKNVIESLIEKHGVDRIENQLKWFNYRDNSWARRGDPGAFIAYVEQNPDPPISIQEEEEKRRMIEKEEKERNERLARDRKRTEELRKLWVIYPEHKKIQIINNVLSKYPFLATVPKKEVIYKKAIELEFDEAIKNDQK